MTSRRKFLKASGAGIAGVSALDWSGTAVAQEAHETVVVGAIGCGGQGTSLARRFAGLNGVEVAYVCDPDANRAETAARTIAEITGKTPKAVADLRTVLDDRSVDAVTVATPDHWHAPAAILACEAGKHVYVEKPCSHNLREGRLLVEAARRSRRVVQHGTQSRSHGLIVHAIQALRDGQIGDVLVARAFNIQQRQPIGHAQPTEPPPRFDYELWLGPAPFVPFQPNRHHYNWHWWYDFGTGDMGNDGVHELDIARWGLGVESHPTTIVAVGGKYRFDDDQQFPDTQTVLFEYPGDGGVGQRRQLVFEMRIWSPYSPDDGIDNGVAFYGTEGWMLLSKRGVVKRFDRKNKPTALSGEIPALPEHHQNFVSAIRTGETPSAEIQVGHISASLCHLGNIATRVARTLRFDPKTETILGDDEAQQLLTRRYREGHWAVPKST
jgi:predicted dehydrogenase